MWRLWLKNLLNLIPSLPLPLQRKWPLMPSGMAAWEYRHTCWRGGKEKGKHRGWRNAPRGSSMGGATDKGKAPLSCRRDRSATVIVMRAWLAVASFLPTAYVFKRSCLPCPVWQKQGKAVWGQETRSRREWSQVQIHACRVLHPVAFPAAKGSEKREK